MWGLQGLKVKFSGVKVQPAREEEVDKQQLEREKKEQRKQAKLRKELGL